MAKRTACLILLLLGGSAAVLYGTLFHRLPVLVEREIEIGTTTLPGPGARAGETSDSHGAAPSPQASPPAAGSAADDGDPFRDPPETAGPGDSENPFDPRHSPPATLCMKPQKFTCSEMQIEPEWVIIREAAVGGVVRLASGALKRTPAKGCPT
jgi:hypothetical protein